MKVSASRRNSSRATALASSRQAGGAPAIPFSRMLQSEEESLFRARLDKLYHEVLELADRLAFSSPLSEWESFRQGVASYLAEVRKSFRLRRAQVWDSFGNQRLLLLVEQADQELIALSLDFLSEAKNDLQFLERIKKLKGLLLDIRS